MPVKQTQILPRETNATAKQSRIFHSLAYESYDSWPREKENKITKKLRLKQTGKQTKYLKLETDAQSKSTSAA